MANVPTIRLGFFEFHPQDDKLIAIKNNQKLMVNKKLVVEGRK